MLSYRNCLCVCVYLCVCSITNPFRACVCAIKYRSITFYALLYAHQNELVKQEGTEARERQKTAVYLCRDKQAIIFTKYPIIHQHNRCHYEQCKVSLAFSVCTLSLYTTTTWRRKKTNFNKKSTSILFASLRMQLSSHFSNLSSFLVAVKRVGSFLLFILLGRFFQHATLLFFLAVIFVHTYCMFARQNCISFWMNAVVLRLKFTFQAATQQKGTETHFWRLSMHVLTCNISISWDLAIAWLYQIIFHSNKNVLGIFLWCKAKPVAIIKWIHCLNKRIKSSNSS